MIEVDSSKLLTWFEQNRRELPWRQTRDPYRIWISEVILQQTRVAQGTDYYLRFVERFPDVGSLAQAPEDEVLRLWQGLGYYSRARNLHAAAKRISLQFGGQFPTTYDQVRALSGVGPYIAAAVCSIACDMPVAVVDGNVYRVLARLLDIDFPIDTPKGQRYFTEVAQELLDKRQPGLYNQALMEFGALQCTPTNPDCAVCPLADGCLALARGTIGERPVKQGKTKIKNLYFNYLDIRWQGKTALKRRDERDIWQGLYEYPLVETSGPIDFAALRTLASWLEEAPVPRSTVVIPRHVLSHRVIHTTFHRIEMPLPEGFLHVDIENLDDYPVSRLIERYREKS